MSREFHFKWNNHLNMMDEFKNFLSYGIMVDVTLACDGKSLKAHKIILSAFSSFFKSLFLENPCKHPIVILKDIKYSELKAILDLIYCGEACVAENQVSALLEAARTLRVKGLGEVGSEENNQSGYESHNSSDGEFEDSATEKSENHPNDETINHSFCSLNVQNETLRQNQEVIGHNNNRDFTSDTEIMENPVIKQEICDDVTDSTSSSNASAIPLNFPGVNSSNSKLKQLLEQGSVSKESFQSSISNLERQTATDNLPEQSFQSSAQLNKELHQNHSDNSSSLVSETSNHVSLDALVTDNQQPSTSSAPVKRRCVAKKTVHQPLKKRQRIEKNRSQNAVKLSHNLRTPEVFIIGDSNSIEEENKTKNSENTKNEMNLYKCRNCPFKTVDQRSLKAHRISRHSQPKKLKCDICPYVTHTKKSLKRHIEVHQEERPYHCNMCTYNFMRTSDLVKHVKKVHKLKNLIYKCKECDFSAADQVSIKKHAIQVHEKIPAVVINKLSENT